MIDYEVLCQAINEWRHQQRPPSGPHDQAVPGESVEEIGSGLVVMDEDESGGAYEAAGETSEQAYEEAPEAEYEAVEGEEAYEEAAVEEAPADEYEEVVDDDDEEIPVEE